MATRSPAAAVAAACLIAALTACGIGSDIPDQPPNPTTEPETPEATTTGDQDPTDDDPAPATAPPECDGILFGTDQEIDGMVLGDCMAAAMLAAGSGAHVVENSTGTSYAQYEWTPDFSMHVQGEVEVVLRGDDGWMRTETGGWVRGDVNSADPEEMMAGTMVELVRAFGDPRAIASVLAQTSWLMNGQESVPDDEALADTAWLLEPTGTIEMFGVTATDVQLWLGADYLGVYFVATASAMGVSDTTSNTFTQWGQPVEIPDPGE
ncbi:hypothetical protein [Pseudactinotalea sp.]|uniref:hypothetical protein n=1 Tax=Pseudactinotalea sp. TaxID=1926260 RepID=UPI003B3B2214